MPRPLPDVALARDHGGGASRSPGLFVGMGDPRPGSLSAHAFSVLAGFALAAAFLVPGLFYGPAGTRGQIEPVSSGVLAGYLVRRLCAGACDHPRQPRADHAVRSRRRDRGDRLAQRSHDRGGAGRGRPRRARHRALGGELQFRDPVLAARPVLRRAADLDDRRQERAPALGRGHRGGLRPGGYWARAVPNGRNSRCSGRPAPC